jgi:hypothetical protein
MHKEGVDEVQLKITRIIFNNFVISAMCLRNCWKSPVELHISAEQSVNVTDLTLYNTVVSYSGMYMNHILTANSHYSHNSINRLIFAKLAHFFPLRYELRFVVRFRF